MCSVVSLSKSLQRINEIIMGRMFSTCLRKFPVWMAAVAATFRSNVSIPWPANVWKIVHIGPVSFVASGSKWVGGSRPITQSRWLSSAVASIWATLVAVNRLAVAVFQLSSDRWTFAKCQLVLLLSLYTPNSSLNSSVHTTLLIALYKRTYRKNNFGLYPSFRQIAIWLLGRSGIIWGSMTERRKWVNMLSIHR